MTRATRRLGFGISLLVHLGLVGGVWLWLQRSPSEPALKAAVVPVRLTMFAEAPPAPVPAAVPAASEPPPAPPEQAVRAPAKVPVKDVTEAVARAEPEPRARPRPVSVPVRPAAKPRPESRPQPVVRAQPEQPMPDVPPAAAPLAAAPVAAPRTAERVALRDAYKAALLAAIERHKFYPNRARRRGIEGQARVGFRVTADGRIERITLVEGSGAALLDRAALRTLERLGTVAPLPAALDMDHWDLVVPIDFRLL